MIKRYTNRRILYFTQPAAEVRECGARTCRLMGMTTMATSRSADARDAISAFDSVRILSYTVTARMTLALPSNVPTTTADSRTAISAASTSPIHGDWTTTSDAATAGDATVAFSVELRSTDDVDVVAERSGANETPPSTVIVVPSVLL